MIVLDTTIVNVALPPSQGSRLHGGLARVGRERVSLDLGGFLLLAGRFGDLYGQRKLFLIGIVIFTLASLACGLATSKGML
jgi:MFS family permease